MAGGRSQLISATADYHQAEDPTQEGESTAAKPVDVAISYDMGWQKKRGELITV